MSNSWRCTVEVQYDSAANDYYIQLTDEMLAQVGWQIGDVLEWIDNQDGSWTLTKKTTPSAST